MGLRNYAREEEERLYEPEAVNDLRETASSRHNRTDAPSNLGRMTACTRLAQVQDRHRLKESETVKQAQKLIYI